ncbi:MAG: VCBS repeat-containing protein [Chitinophagaceae bacterium]|nr:VCBS repeat-containing protein [Chitinophagaceae bacterium]
MRKIITISFLWTTITAVLLVNSFFILNGCSNDKTEKRAMFRVLDDKRTGLHFVNKLTPAKDFNIFNYMYFYNGAGIGAGDFNNDGLTDLFFASNQGRNSIFMNKGGLAFSDLTEQAGIPQDGGWSTGVSVVDINNDGLLDIYVCRVGNYEVLKGRNQFLICKHIDENGIPHYEDEARQYGLDFSGFSTQAVFFDYDMDDDLDMFLLNHAVHQNGSFAPRANFAGTYSLISGDRMFRNDGNTFTDVTKGSGINSSVISYGLGVVASDINLDGWTDLYVGNDFHENDYLYINQRNGTFSEESGQRMMHTSEFSMGVDAADVNNDGYPEIISMDMLPSDPYILKRSLGDDDHDVFYQKIAAGYNYQYSRNNLQYNRRNGHFSEAGLYSGIYATDWSWASLWMDFNNDGSKDLFISNGIPKRLNDMDYINFISNDEVQQKIRNNQMDDRNMALIKKFPEIKIPNKFYRNTGELLFQDIKDSIANDQPSYSNGAVYTDLDNDGDLDIVVNNIDDPVLLYENTCNNNSRKTFAEIKLNGPEKNGNAVGAKIVLFSGSSIMTYDNYPVRGFLSSMQSPLHLGLNNKKIDSAFLIWPDNSCQPVKIDTNKIQSYKYAAGLPVFDYSGITAFIKNKIRVAEDITASTGIQYLHRENTFNEFNREPLIPHWVSTEGPALAVTDINKDGLDDIFIGASKNLHNAIFLQRPGGKFYQAQQSALFADSTYEDADAIWADVNNDACPDLIIASGGNEYYGQDRYLLPRIYLNDGKGILTKKEDAFRDIYMTASCVVANDFNADGFIDLFIGGRAVPWAYGEIPRSFLLQNDGTGKFTDVTEKYAAGLAKIGMVTKAVWFDIDKDNQTDLLVSCEWGGIYAFINDKGQFRKKVLTDKKGWWNFVFPFDADGDGDIDLVAGNLGLNSRLKATGKQPVNMYFNDFDDNGKKEQVLTYFVGGKEVPFSSKDDLQKQMPALKKKFLYAEDFARSSLEKIFSKEKLNTAEVLSADYFSNTILINRGNLDFMAMPLPWEAQLTSYRDAAVIDANNDELPDIMLAGNYYSNNIQMGRYDADYGTILVNKGDGLFSCEKINGLTVKGQVRHIRPATIAGRKSFVLSRNDDSVMVVRFR